MPSKTYSEYLRMIEAENAANAVAPLRHRRGYRCPLNRDLYERLLVIEATRKAGA